MSKRRIAIVLAVVAALFVGYKLYDRSSADESEDAKSESGGKSPDEVARVEQARARRVAALKAPRSVLAGTVIDGDSGAPIAGAVVSLGRTSLDLGAKLGAGEAKSPIMTVSGDDGTFRIGELRSGELSLTASAGGYLPTSRDAILLKPGEENTAIELVMRRGGLELSGTVTDVGGGGVAGAYVSARRVSEGTVATIFRAPTTALSDSEGRYKITLQEGNYLLQAGHADYITVTRDTQLIGSARTEDFELIPGAIISGRVLIAGTDKPVADAIVAQLPRGARITGAAFGPAAKTGADGRFIMTGLKSGEINLIATARQYASKAPKTVVVGIAETRTDVTLYVDAAYSISGFVVDKNDNSKPLARVLVAAYNFGQRSAAVTSDPSAEDGYFEISGVMPGPYTIGAVGEGRLPELVSQLIEVKDKDIDGLLVELDRGLTITGRVDPPVAAYVRLEVDTGSLSLTGIPRVIASQLARTSADENGRFELTGLTPGKVTVVAEHVEHGAGRIPVDVSAPGLSDVVVKLETTGSIAGRVTDELGKPVASARVRARGEGSRSIGFGSSFGEANRTITNSDGTFVVRGLAAETYRLSVRRDSNTLDWAGPSIALADGNKSSPIEIELDDGETRKGLNLVVEASNEKIRGQVIDAEGQPVADAWVKVGSTTSRGFRGPNGQRRGPPREEASGEDEEDDDQADDPLFTRYKPRLSDPDGYFAFDGLKSGEYWVSATGPRGETTGTVRPVTTGSSVTVKLVKMGSVSGVVTSGGEPLTTFTLKVEGPRIVQQPVSADSGGYRVDRLPAGKYEIHIQAEDGRARKSVQVTGDDQVVNFEIEAYSGVTGTVIGIPSQKPLGGFAVIAVSEGSDTDSLGAQVLTGDVPKTDENGRFSISRQGFGDATILVINAIAGLTPVGRKTVALEKGKSVDAGNVYALETPPIPENLRGTLGLTTRVATFKDRPSPVDGQSAPPGSETKDEFLWVGEVAANGPAALAGVLPGDRIAIVDGIDLAIVGPSIGSSLLGNDRNGVGTLRTLSIDRNGTPQTIEVTAGPKAP